MLHRTRVLLLNHPIGRVDLPPPLQHSCYNLQMVCLHPITLLLLLLLLLGRLRPCPLLLLLL